MLTAPHVGFRPTVAIIGAGASGMLLATHLLRISTVRQVPVRAVLIDRKGIVRMVRVGSGPANAADLEEEIKSLIAEK